MKRFSEQFKKQSETIRLTTAEREDLRERISTYMEYHPRTTKPVETTPDTQPVRSSGLWRRWRVLLGGVVALSLLLVPVLAEQSKPGDILYAIKVGLNEEVRDTLSSSSYEKVEWETEQLNRRLVEAQLLAQEGRLTGEMETEVAAAVRKHSESARKSIAAMRETNPDEAALAEITLNALLDVHSSVLSAQATASGTRVASASSTPVAASSSVASTSTDRGSTESDTISAAIAQSLDVASSSQGVMASPSVARLLKQIEKETAEAYALLEEIEPTKATTVLHTVPRRLEDVDRKVQAAITANDSGSTVEARVLLTEALVRTRKVITYLQNWQMGSRLSLDTVLPIEYTAEELTQQLRQKTERLKVRYDYIQDVRIEYTSNATDTDAVLAKLNDVPRMFATATVAVSEDEFSRAGTVLTNIERALDAVVETLQIPDRLPDPVTNPSVGTTTAPASSTPEVSASSTPDQVSSSTPTVPATSTVDGVATSS
jgi:hypothetical protein